MAMDHPVLSRHHRPDQRPRKEWRVQPARDKPNIMPQGQPTKAKVIDSPVFLPYMRDSTLRKSVQELDDSLGECMGAPAVCYARAVICWHERKA